MADGLDPTTTAGTEEATAPAPPTTTAPAAGDGSGATTQAPEQSPEIQRLNEELHRIKSQLGQLANQRGGGVTTPTTTAPAMDDATREFVDETAMEQYLLTNDDPVIRTQLRNSRTLRALRAEMSLMRIPDDLRTEAEAELRSGRVLDAETARLVALGRRASQTPAPPPVTKPTAPPVVPGGTHTPPPTHPGGPVTMTYDEYGAKLSDPNTSQIDKQKLMIDMAAGRIKRR